MLYIQTSSQNTFWILGTLIAHFNSLYTLWNAQDVEETNDKGA